MLEVIPSDRPLLHDSERAESAQLVTCLVLPVAGVQYWRRVWH